MSKNSWWKQSGVARRDERATRDTPEVATKGKRSHKKKPWIVEYRLPKREIPENIWSMWHYDGEWHNYVHQRYATMRDALKAMEAEESKSRRNWGHERLADIQWRIRNTEEQ